MKSGNNEQFQEKVGAIYKSPQLSFAHYIFLHPKIKTNF